MEGMSPIKIHSKHVCKCHDEPPPPYKLYMLIKKKESHWCWQEAGVGEVD
jgi:hypothetical protein